MSKHTHKPNCPRNINWDAMALCDKEPECTCQDTPISEKHTPEAEWEWHDDYCKACGCGHESLESDKEGILLHNAAWSMKPGHKKLIALAPTLQARIDRLKDELKLNIIAMNAGSSKIDQLEAEKVELFDLVKRAGIHARHCPNCSEYILGIVKEARAIYAKTEPREGMG